MDFAIIANNSSQFKYIVKEYKNDLKRIKKTN